MKTIASTPKKVILVGEHFAVYDKLATVIAIDRRRGAHVTAELRSG